MIAHVRARIVECVRLDRGQQAEADGLRAALFTDRPIPYSSDPYLQARYTLGFRDGTSLLALEGTPEDGAVDGLSLMGGAR